MLRILKISALVSVVILLNAVTTLLFVQNAVPASAGPQCVNGDINGDATVDITDPIHLLSYIFEGGPEPIACAQAPTSAELEYVLQKFFPKFENFVTIEALNQQTVEFVVPPNQLLVITTIYAQSTPRLLVDGAVANLLPNDLWIRYVSSTPFDSRDRRPETSYRVFQPGQVLTFFGFSSTGGNNETLIKGFYVDL
jgi:hypothetical protein